MKPETIITGVIALVVWVFIWHHASRRSPLRWASPASLFATGLLVFYIIPSLYWQFRTWTYSTPSYLDGLSLVFTGTIILGLPFLWHALLAEKRKDYRMPQTKPQLQSLKTGNAWLILLIPLLIGIGWRIYLLSMGWQARLEREIPTLLGSESLALIIQNFSYYYPAVYFILVALGNNVQRRTGKVIWILDGFLQLILFSRFKILRFILLSLIFSTLLRWKLTFRQWIVIGTFSLFVLSVIGMSNTLAQNYLIGSKKFMSPFQVAQLLKDGTVKYLFEEVEGTHFSSESNPLLKGLDDAMYRLYDARSASAVMMSVPDVLPYSNGRTFIHILYSLIPRYFWPQKPHLDNIHQQTNKLMYPERGNPVGTIAELYMNFGFVSVLLGGIVSFLLCQLGEKILTRKSGISPAWIGMYPLLAEQYIQASYNFTQRISEGIHALLVWILIAMLLHIASKRYIIRFHNTHRPSTGLLNPHE